MLQILQHPLYKSNQFTCLFVVSFLLFRHNNRTGRRYDNERARKRRITGNGRTASAVIVSAVTVFKRRINHVFYFILRHVSGRFFRLGISGNDNLKAHRKFIGRRRATTATAREGITTGEATCIEEYRTALVTVGSECCGSALVAAREAAALVTAALAARSRLNLDGDFKGSRFLQERP